MENLNLGMILRHGAHSEQLSGSDVSSLDAVSAGRKARNGATSSTSLKAARDGKLSDDDSSDGEHGLAGLGQSESVAMHSGLSMRPAGFDPSDDSAGLRRYWDALFYPEVYVPIFYALRITFMVALPLSILARHPKVMGTFPAHVVLPLWGIVDCKYTFGEQLAQSIVSYQVGLWMGLWGGVNNVWNLLGHHSAWWCSVIFGCFAMSLLGDVRAKRLLVLQTVMILQMENLPGGTELDYPIRVGRDMIMATTFALFQVLFPLRSIAKECDELTAGAWRNTYRILRSSTRACWADDPIDRALALADCTTEPLQTFFSTINGKLFFITYEFWESTLRLELRRERVRVLKDMVTRIHALTDTSRTLVTSRVLNIVRGKEKLASKDAAPPRTPRRRRGSSMAKSAPPSPVFKENVGEDEGYPVEDGDEAAQAQAFARTSRRQYQALAGADRHSHDPYADAEDEGGAAFLTKAPRPMSDDMRMWNRTKELLREPLEEFFLRFHDVFEGLSMYLNPRDVTEKVPFQPLREASQSLQAALNRIHFEILIKGSKEVDPMQYTSTIFYHLMLIETAQIVLDYGDLMINFDRKRYKSQWVRTWEFFFYDYWRDFWIELPKRMTLATPRDVRILKDGIKMACAYGVGVMFTEYTDKENVYYFGMAILMGVGWPTVGDTMVASVYRVTGMALACSIAYIAVWHTHNLTQELAISLAGVFIALLFRDRPPYSHTAQYCSMLVVTALNSAGTKLVLLARVVSNCFTVMTYYAIVVFLFPTDVLKITFATQVCVVDSVAQRFTRLVSVMQNPFSFDDEEHLEALQTELRMIGDLRDPMWGHLMTLGAWLPKAANEPTVRGEPYPIASMRNVFSSLRRLASATDVLHATVTLLFRTRMEGAMPTALSMYTGLIPLLHKMDRRARRVLGDFIDAMYRPYEWSAEAATRNLSRFLALNEDLHAVFNESHRRHTEALREHFRNSVVNRTFAHAARNFLLDPSSFAGPSHQSGRPDGGKGTASHALVNENASFASRQELQKVLQERREKPVFTADEMVSCLEKVSAAPSPASRDGAPSPTHSARSSTSSSGSGIEALDDPSKQPVSREVAQRLMTSFALPASRREGFTDHPLTDAGERHAPFGRQGDGDDTDGSSTGHLEAVLRPIQEVAEEEEYHAFITDAIDNREDFSLRNDVNKVITILVATDMFFGEAERLVKTMYAINRYARSRQKEPSSHKAQRQSMNSEL